MPNSDFPGAGGLLQTPGDLSLRPELAAVLIFEALAAACRHRESPWRTPVLASVSSAGAAEARMLVMREAGLAARRLTFHSDLRSAKLRAIAANPSIELCFWDPAAQLQLRARGEARVAADSARRDSAWARVPVASRRNYARESAPGTVLATETASLSADGFAHFAILDVEVERLEWLWLGAAGHQRGQTVWDGALWQAERLVP